MQQQLEQADQKLKSAEKEQSLYSELNKRLRSNLSDWRDKIAAQEREAAEVRHAHEVEMQRLHDQLQTLMAQLDEDQSQSQSQSQNHHDSLEKQSVG